MTAYLSATVYPICVMIWTCFGTMVIVFILEESLADIVKCVADIVRCAVDIVKCAGDIVEYFSR